ncbi:JMJD7 [Mytilus edulis]|uniref:JMJD7 n=1 Tax=Mytilus edulis TaxID=6550 RepID=A0A8S3U532_MYTED|nr:JMJD7 [Mytilus edulis]
MRSEHLKGHKITHSGDKPFACPVEDTAEKNNYMTNSFTSGDGMTSRGITFRDPETGCCILQTQLLQISGQKQVLLFEPHDNTRLYESHIPEAMLAYNHSTKQFTRNQLAQSTSMVMSPVDIKKVDFKRFPKFASTYPLNCTLNEGDVLFMPSFWWHEVQSVPNRKEKRNLAVNYWYEPFLTKEFPCPTCKLDVNPKYRHLL